MHEFANDNHLAKQLNVSINPDGSVFDADVKMSYNTLLDWLNHLKNKNLTNPSIPYMMESTTNEEVSL